MNNFWQGLSKPFLVLAPMEDVTDTVFRQMVTSCARPDVFFTEFTNCDGLQSKGRSKVIDRLKFSNIEHPIVAQIWGITPENFKKSAQEIKEMGFDGIDLNMGCPEKSVLKTGGGGALINNPALAKELILATKEGAGDLPISVKTRIGFKCIQTEDWIGFLLEQDLDALTIHGRTVEQLSEGLPHWEEIERAVELKNKINKKTLIIGNGDVTSWEQAQEKAHQFGVDGVMIGRGVFSNLWVFDKSGKKHDFSPQKRLQLLLDHVRLFDKTWGNNKNFAILKKFFKIYISDFPGASDLRARLMGVNSLKEVEQIVIPLIL